MSFSCGTQEEISPKRSTSFGHFWLNHSLRFCTPSIFRSLHLHERELEPCVDKQSRKTNKKVFLLSPCTFWPFFVFTEEARSVSNQTVNIMEDREFDPLMVGYFLVWDSISSRNSQSDTCAVREIKSKVKTTRINDQAFVTLNSILSCIPWRF